MCSGGVIEWKIINLPIISLISYLFLRSSFGNTVHRKCSIYYAYSDGIYTKLGELCDKCNTAHLCARAHARTHSACAPRLTFLHKFMRIWFTWCHVLMKIQLSSHSNLTRTCLLMRYVAIIAALSTTMANIVKLQQENKISYSIRLTQKHYGDVSIWLWS